MWRSWMAILRHESMWHINEEVFFARKNFCIVCMKLYPWFHESHDVPLAFNSSPYFILIRNLETNVSIGLDPGLVFSDNQDGKYFVDSVPIGELCLLQWLQYIYIYDAPKILLCYKKNYTHTLIHYITLIGEKICRSFNLKASNQFSAASTSSLLVTATFDQVLSFIKIILISTS